MTEQRLSITEFRELMQAWHDALLSPDERQGFHMLENTDEQGGVSRCCLGVLTRVCMNRGLVSLRAEVVAGRTYFFDSEDVPNAEVDLLPRAVCQVTGLMPNPQLRTDTLDPYVELLRNFGVQPWAASLNDNEGYTFPMIAEVVKRTFLDATDEEIEQRRVYRTLRAS